MKRFLIALSIPSIALVAAPLTAQHAALRVKGYVRDDKGAPIANARSLFRRAIERDRMSYRATLRLASIFLYDRDFDSASRAFDAARNRTKDKEEHGFMSAAIGDLATIKVR
jgi:thioredoxin-like negative regulator of GroEL